MATVRGQLTTKEPNMPLARAFRRLRPARPACRAWPALALRALLLGWLALAGNLSVTAQPLTQAAPRVQLRVVGGLGSLAQYREFEEPFWRQELPALTQGRVTAHIAPFDKAGIRTHEAMRLMQLGVVPFGTVLLTTVMGTDAELAAMDLAGLNPDMASLRRSVAAFRPHFERVMRERHGIEVLAIYTYPGQVTFCKHPLKGLGDLAGRRVRVSNPTQADLIRPWGGVAVQTEFSEVVAQVRSGHVDCAITGAASGHAVGLHEVTSHLYTGATNWGVSMFGANTLAWQALPADVRSVIQTALPKLEEAIWADAERQHLEGAACNTGQGPCRSGKPGRMVEVKPDASDLQQLRDTFSSSVLPSWVQRCGPACVPVWNQWLGPVAGVQAKAPTAPR